MTAITFGVFDLTHIGHFNLFRRMKALADRVVVFVQDSASVPATKGGRQTVLSTRERAASAGACRWVDEVHVYRWLGTRHLRRVLFDMLVVGPEHHLDERFQRMFRWCRAHGRKVVTLPRTKGVSTTQIIERVKRHG